MEFLTCLPFGLNLIYVIIIDMLKKIVFTTSLLSLMLIVALLNLTTPSSVGPLGILAAFIMLYAIFLGLTSFFIYGVRRTISLFSPNKKIQPSNDIIFRKSYYYSTAIAFAPVALIAQQSIGNVGFFEIFLILTFEIFACIYISKR